MTDKELADKELAAWAETRPESIRLAVKERDPRKLYRLKSSGHIVFIMSYVEPNAGSHVCEACKNDLLPGHQHATWPEVTVTVGVTRQYNPFLLMERRVFGIKLDDLEEVP